MKLTKIDVAAAQISAAVRIFFEGGHPVPIFTLANAAREIVATIGKQMEIRTVQSELAKQRGISVSEMSRIANFFKHADRDADNHLEFDEDDLEVVLQLACHDFGRIAGGMPIEAQIYEAWITAIAFPRVSNAPLRHQQLIRAVIRYFPGIRSADRMQRKRIGLTVLNRAMQDAALRRDFRRAVIFPKKPTAQT
jgi:cytidylate kinase